MTRQQSQIIDRCLDAIRLWHQAEAAGDSAKMELARRTRDRAILEIKTLSPSNHIRTKTEAE